MEKEFLSACYSGDLQTVERILSDKTSNININYQGEGGRTGLLLASGLGHVQILKRLLLVGNIDINIPDNNGLHPVHAAARYGHNTIISLLLDHGADVNIQQEPDGQTPLYMAAMGGKKDTIELLIKKGGDINITDKYGRNMLHAACMYGQTGLIPFFLQLGFNVNCQIDNLCKPIYLATKFGKNGTVTKLLQEGADPGIAKFDRFTPLHIAAQKGHDKCVEILIPVSDKNKQAPGVNNNTPLIGACYHGHTKSAEFLLKAGADLSIRGTNGKDALELAAEEGHASCVTLLLQHGAQVDRTWKIPWPWSRQSTAEQLARAKSHTEVVRILEDHKRNPGKYKIKENMAPKSEAKRVKLAEAGGKKTIREPEQCPVYKAAADFIKAMGLKDGYFEKDFDVCFCTTCHTTRGDNLYYARGDPPKDYALPIGWVKFGLRIPAWAMVEEAMEKWHVAFHGTKVPNVEKILRTGDFLKPGDVTPSGSVLRPPPGHFDDENPDIAPPPGFDIYKIYLSPSIRYSGCNVYAPLWRWNDKHLRVAFQVRTQPGTYDVGPETIGAKGPIDPHFLNSELEWSTKRRGVTVLVGLLVRIEGLGGEPDTKMLRQAASDAAALPQPILEKGRTVALLYPFCYQAAPGFDISLQKGDKVTIASVLDDTVYKVTVPAVKQGFVIPKSFLDI